MANGHTWLTIYFQIGPTSSWKEVNNWNRHDNLDSSNVAVVDVLGVVRSQYFQVSLISIDKSSSKETRLLSTYTATSSFCHIILIYFASNKKKNGDDQEIFFATINGNKKITVLIPMDFLVSKEDHYGLKAHSH